MRAGLTNPYGDQDMDGAAQLDPEFARAREMWRVVDRGLRLLAGPERERSVVPGMGMAQTAMPGTAKG